MNDVHVMAKKFLYPTTTTFPPCECMVAFVFIDKFLG